MHHSTGVQLHVYSIVAICRAPYVAALLTHGLSLSNAQLEIGKLSNVFPHSRWVATLKMKLSPMQAAVTSVGLWEQHWLRDLVQWAATDGKKQDPGKAIWKASAGCKLSRS